MGCHFLLQCKKVKSEREVSQSYLTLSDPMDCSLPGSSIHGICQARVLEWGAIAFVPKPVLRETLINMTTCACILQAEKGKTDIPFTHTHVSLMEQRYVVIERYKEFGNCVCVCVCVCTHLVTQLCPTFRDTLDSSLPSSSVHGILQARTLEWAAISFSRGSSPSRD